MKVTRHRHSILWLSEDDGFVKSQGNKIGHIMTMSKNSQKKVEFSLLFNHWISVFTNNLKTIQVTKVLGGKTVLVHKELRHAQSFCK